MIITHHNVLRLLLILLVVIVDFYLFKAKKIDSVEKFLRFGALKKRKEKY
jgi:hypothetical protein